MVHEQNKKREGEGETMPLLPGKNATLPTPADLELNPALKVKTNSYKNKYKWLPTNAYKYVPYCVP